MNAVQRAEHRTELLVRRRCPECAETAPSGAILRGEACPRCKAPLVVEPGGDHAARMLAAVREDWNRWRLVVYGAVVASSVAAGLVPLFGTAVAVFAMLLGHLMLLRRPLRWLSPARRMLTRLAIKVWFAILGVTALFMNVAAAPFVALGGIGAIFSGVVGLGVTALYLEGSLEILARRIEREATEPRLSFWEWAVPVGLLAALAVTGFAGVIALWIALNAATSVSVPGVAELARWLLEVP